MSDNKKKESKVKLTLRQLGDPNKTERLEYEVIDTSCARFACKEVYCRDVAINLCDKHEVTIVYKEDDQKVSGFSN